MMKIIRKIAVLPIRIFKGIKHRVVSRRNRWRYKKEQKRIEIRTKHLSLSVPELFMHEHIGNAFNRYDMIVRLLAIECEKGINDYGWDFYRRMQIARVGEDGIKGRISNFKKLINSYDTNGYDKDSEIELDTNLHLIDGSHRMAMALYHHLSVINVKVRPYPDSVFYGIEWFHINGFSNEECSILERKYRQLVGDGNFNVPFVCTLWHPVRAYFDEITEHLRQFGKVTEIKDFSLSEWDYRFYTKGIYHVDDIADWKIEKKLEYMMSAKTEVYQLRMVVLELTDPDFRLKDSTNGTLSRKCEFIKQLIRDAYKGKVENYFHDIIMHIGDNFHQNECIYRLLTMPPINVKSILEHLSTYKYVITKVDTPYMPKDFPMHYPLGKDLDIICADKEEYEKVLESIKRDVEAYKDSYDIRFVKKQDDDGNVYRTLIRLGQEDYLIFLLDIACRAGNLSYDFSKELCNNRIKKDCYFVPHETAEIIVRIDEMTANPNKLHHIAYVREHISLIDDSLCERFLNDSARHSLEKIVIHHMSVK